MYICHLYPDPSGGFLKAVSEFAYCNPFLPEHNRLERELLGADFVEGDEVWSKSVSEDPEQPRVNVWRIFEKLGPVVEQIRERPKRGEDLALYEDAVVQYLYQRYYPRFYAASFAPPPREAGRWRFYQEFLKDWTHFFEWSGASRWPGASAYLRLLPPDPVRLRAGFPRHHRQLHARRAAARQRMAIDFHPRYAAVPEDALRPDA